MKQLHFYSLVTIWEQFLMNKYKVDIVKIKQVEFFLYLSVCFIMCAIKFVTSYPAHTIDWLIDFKSMSTRLGLFHT